MATGAFDEPAINNDEFVFVIAQQFHKIFLCLAVGFLGVPMDVTVTFYSDAYLSGRVRLSLS